MSRAVLGLDIEIMSNERILPVAMRLYVAFSEHGS